MGMQEKIVSPIPVLGKHLLAEFYDATNLFDPQKAICVFKLAAKAGGATLLDINMHDFGVRAGFTGVVILAESHISIHTWPEHDYAAIDIFMCGDAEPSRSLEVLKDYFKPSSTDIQLIERGLRVPVTTALLRV